MADIENPDVDDGSGPAVAEAEPAECSRRVCMCLLGCVALAIILAFHSFLDFKESHPTKTTGIMVDIGWFLAALVGGWLLFIFMVLVGDWFEGNPEGKGLVDNLIESDRPCLLESFCLVLGRCDQDYHVDDA
ncbi:hypothetical protein ZWY2020_016332 [Hordeum vulgare]|nr:hypothetical protein ZWY2020_016332 [Hordeum vulgare]